MKTLDPIVEKFRPPTYYEVKTGKPYRARIGKTKYVFQVNQFSAVAMVRVYEIGISICKRLDEIANRKHSEGGGFSSLSVELIQNYVALASFLWEISDKPRGFIKRIRMRMAFMKYALSNIDWLLKIKENVLSANARISFFFETPGELLSDSAGTMAGDGFQVIVGTHGDANHTPWAEYIHLREKEKLDIINKWKVDKKAQAEAKRNRRK